jgi:hypothetical protein
MNGIFKFNHNSIYLYRMAKGKKIKRKSMKELAKGVAKFLKDKEVNENNEQIFNKTLKRTFKPDSK